MLNGIGPFLYFATGAHGLPHEIRIAPAQDETSGSSSAEMAIATRPIESLAEARIVAAPNSVNGPGALFTTSALSTGSISRVPTSRR